VHVRATAQYDFFGDATLAMTRQNFLPGSGPNLVNQLKQLDEPRKLFVLEGRPCSICE
jgi:hypothetical protein